MEAWKCCSLIVGLIVILGVQSGYGIKCYVCNSGEKYEKAPCAAASELKNHPDLLKDCAGEEMEDHMPNGTYIYCRVMTQNVEGDYRVVRQCASAGRLDRCIERTGTKNIKMSYCHCDEDGCNGASGLVAPVTAVLALLSAVWALRT